MRYVSKGLAEQPVFVGYQPAEILVVLFPSPCQEELLRVLSLYSHTCHVLAEGSSEASLCISLIHVAVCVLCMWVVCV